MVTFTTESFGYTVADGMGCLTDGEDTASGLSFIACDMVGNLLGSAHYANRPAGEWQESINLTHRPIGGVLMLNVQCAGQEMRIKVSQ